jgi:hypothetical protein
MPGFLSGPQGRFSPRMNAIQSPALAEIDKRGIPRFWGMSSRTVESSNRLPVRIAATPSEVMS